MKKALILISHPNEFAGYVEQLLFKHPDGVSNINSTNLVCTTVDTEYHFCVLQTDLNFSALHSSLSGSAFDMIDITRFQADLIDIVNHVGKIINSSCTPDTQLKERSLDEHK